MLEHGCMLGDFQTIAVCTLPDFVAFLVTGHRLDLQTAVPGAGELIGAFSQSIQYLSQLRHI
jgi:hypothetical protein